MRTLLVLPTLNEEAGVQGVLEDALRHEDRFDVVVVDGRSEDATVALAHAAGVHVVQQRGRGKGAAIRTAIDVFLAGPWDALAMIDADGTYAVDALVDVLPMLDHHPVLVGDRLQGPLEPSSMGRLNFLGNRFLSAVASAVHRTDAADVCSGCWVMRRSIVEGLRLNSLGFELEAELFASLAAMGHAPTWVRIPYRAREGEAKLTSILDGVRILRKLVVRRVMQARKTHL